MCPASLSHQVLSPPGENSYFFNPLKINSKKNQAAPALSCRRSTPASTCALAAVTAPSVQTLAEPFFAPQRFPDVPLAGGEREVNVDHAPGKEAQQTAGKMDGYSKNVPRQLDVFSSFSLCCKAPPSFCLLLGGGGGGGASLGSSGK